MTNTSDIGRRYNLVGLSEKQAEVLSDAAEFLCRVGMGQLDAVMNMARFGGITGKAGEPIGFDQLDEGDRLVNQLQLVLTGYPSNASKGIGNEHTPAAAKIAFELHKALRHRLAWDRNPQGGHGVHFDDPYSLLRYSSEPEAWLTQDKPAIPLHDELPEGCFLGRQGSTWRVVVAEDREVPWLVVGEAHDPATAVAKAKAYLLKKNGTV
jgi:hypothetical protein